MSGPNTPTDHAGAPSDTPPSPPGAASPGPAEDNRPVLRAVLALTAVVGLAFAALVLRPATGLFSTGSAPLGRASGWVALLGIGWAIVVGTVSRDYRAAVRHLTGLTPRAERLTRTAAWLLPTAAVVLPVAALAAVNAHHRPPPTPRLPQAKLPQVPPQGGADHTAVGNAIVIVFALLILVLLVLLGRLLLNALRNRRRGPRRTRRRGPVPSRALDEQEQLAAAVGSGRQALLGADARAAVIACYAAMEESLAASGVARRIADSPSELLARAVALGTVPTGAGTALTALFREARYSRHPMGAPELDRARAALDTIARHIGQPAEGVS
ncbi:DUF4129 domain-containing protein [Kitasatospora acidiphila]|uniref:DUF4129 domain-containing protein n=1 Tax=Kitasatospora acidiphila TaxID=2567942 RepID=A0A540W046_9ACTN|nr:DUF4129 domain-containing protein [Kitasatospora acidiphila]TQF02396.1 DUF4129 domain-containing protein [Kitasatospora acidiphila]